jgi:hypothetical protein
MSLKMGVFGAFAKASIKPSFIVIDITGSVRDSAFSLPDNSNSSPIFILGRPSEASGVQSERYLSPLRHNVRQ